MHWMRKALDLARLGRQSCPPNPMVGCLIIKNHQIVGQGFHQKTGCKHAEVIALEQAGEQACQADVYLTLEPCSHFGHTPPCVDALIQAKVKRVHLALLDSNPLVQGRGVEKLRQAGIEVHLEPVGSEYQEEAYHLNQDFFHVMTHQRPFVIAKWAMSLDGKIATVHGQSKWITSQSALTHAHQLRSQVCAVMIGANTLKRDNPQLTVRHGFCESAFAQGNLRQPRSIVVTASGEISLDGDIFKVPKRVIVITSDEAPSSFINELKGRQIDYHVFPLVRGKFQMSDVLSSMWNAYKFKSILVEGGSDLLTSLYREKLINQIYAYIAPKIMGGLNSLSPIQGENLRDIMEMEQLHSQKVISLEPDFCVMAKTSQTPQSYGEFLARNKEISHV